MTGQKRNIYLFRVTRPTQTFLSFSRRLHIFFHTKLVEGTCPFGRSSHRIIAIFPRPRPRPRPFAGGPRPRPRIFPTTTPKFKMAAKKGRGTRGQRSKVKNQKKFFFSKFYFWMIRISIQSLFDFDHF